MTRFVLRRLAYGVVMVILATMFVFSLSRLAGDPRNLYLGQEGIYVTKETWEAWGREMGLDKPLPVQYTICFSKALKGDFGTSLSEKANARNVIAKRIPATLQLAGAGFLWATAVGVPLGVLAAVKRGTIWDLLGRIFALLGQTLPAFWVGLMLILVFAVWLDLLPTSQKGGLKNLILPSVTLGWAASAGFLRLLRSSMLEVLDSEYVKLAKAKGVSLTAVIWKHAFKNAIIVPLTYAGLLLATFLTGTVVVETVFAWPGIGRLAVQAVFQNDFPVMTGLVMLFTVVYVGMNLAVDILYGFIDPRIRYA